MCMLKRHVTNRLQLVENDLRSLRETLAEVKSEQRLLLVEWEETLRKITNTLRSISRSGGKVAPAAVEIDAAAGVPLGPDQISEAIHARRNRAVPHAESETGG